MTLRPRPARARNAAASKPGFSSSTIVAASIHLQHLRGNLRGTRSLLLAPDPAGLKPSTELARPAQCLQCTVATLGAENATFQSNLHNTALNFTLSARF